MARDPGGKQRPTKLRNGRNHYLFIKKQSGGSFAVIKTQGPSNGRSWRQHTARSREQTLGTTQTLFHPAFSAQGLRVGVEAPSGHWNSGAAKTEFTCQVGGPWAGQVSLRCQWFFNR